MDYNLYAAKVFKVSTNVVQRLGSSWFCPPASMIKVNVDAHTCVDSHGGLGTVARNEFGQVVWGSVRKTPANWEVELAELAAIRFGCQVPRRMGYEQVQIERGCSVCDQQYL